MTIIEKLDSRVLFTTLNLDPTFDGDGVVYNDWGWNDEIHAIAVDASDRVIAGGDNGHIARFLTNGQLDSTFNVTTLRSGMTIDEIMVMPDGGIIVAGRDTWYDSPFIKRFSATGAQTWSLGDSTMLGNGAIADLPVSLAKDSQGNFYLAATSSNWSFTSIELIKINSTGTSFEANILDTTANASYAQDLAITPDDKLVVLGHQGAPMSDARPTDPFVLRMNNIYAGDTTFGDGTFGDGTFGLWPGDLSNRCGTLLSAHFAGAHYDHLDRLLVTSTHGYYIDGRFHLTATGLIDTGYAQYGELGSSSFSDIAMRNDKLFAVGNGETDCSLGVFTPAGQPDTTFGFYGVRDEQFASNYGGNTFNAMTFDSAGNLIAGGWVDVNGTMNWLITRYVGEPIAPPFSATVTATIWDDSDGNGFQTAVEVGLANRTVTLDLNPNNYNDVPITVQTDANGVARFTVTQPGTVLVTASSISGRKSTTSSGAMVDVTQSKTYSVGSFGFRAIPANTHLDSTYGANGLVALSGYARAARFTSDGKVFIAFADGKVERRSVATGALDTSWGTGGIAQAVPANSGRTIYDLLVQPDGKLLIASQNSDIFVDRLLTTGAVDTGFGVSGTRKIDFGANEFMPNLAFGLNNTIIVAAEQQTPSLSGISSTCIARLLPTGALDTNFDGDGMRTYRPSNTQGWYFHPGTLVTQTDGKMLFAAQQDNSPFGEVIVRLDTDGKLDTSFAGGDGIYFIAVAPNTNISITNLAIDSAGRIIYAGRGAESPGNTTIQMTAGRLTSTGVLDTSFGTSGATRATFRQSLTNAVVPSTTTALAIGLDGSIVLAGYAYTTAAYSSDVAVMYLKPDGILDTAFGINGLARMATGSNMDAAVALTVGADRKPLVVTNGTTSTLSRFNVPMAASITGTLYNDLNNNASKDTGEPGLANRTVYLDVDYDGVLDANETRTTTDANGAYLFGGLSAGVYAVRQVLPARWSQTAPTSNEAVWMSLASGQAFTNANLGLRNTGGPAVVSSTFQNETKIAFDMTWEESVAGSLDAADVSVINTATNAVLASSFWTLSVVGNTASVQLLPTTPDGNYRVQIRANGVASSSGVTNPSLITLPTFRILAGDANRNGAVNFDDLLILAQNYGQSGRTFSQGNFNYSADGKVDFDDLLILAQKYNATLPALAAAPATKRKTRVGFA